MTYSSQFEKDVDEGLSQSPKRLSSRYFYDDAGTDLFRQIMALDEYYLPECELEILKTRTADIASAYGHQQFDVVELGAGDGSKTVYFLKALIDNHLDISYYPLDISSAALEINSAHISRAVPSLDIHPIEGNYFNTLSDLEHRRPRLIMFMGSNIGNFDTESAIRFLKLIKSHLQQGDALLIGIDLRKNPRTILKAYDDSKGVTRCFNLNLLWRINRELDGNFNISAFDHYPFYNPVEGTTYSYIVSLQDQDVTIAGRNYKFHKNELLHTEISKKYSLNEIDELCDKSGFTDPVHFLDSKEYFSVSLFKS